MRRLRVQFEEIRRALRQGGGEAFLIECRRAGEDGEGRAPGVYYDPPDSLCPVVVFAGEEPDPKVLAQFRGAPGQTPLVVVLGPCEVPRPQELST